jgi:hypothetical protein
MPPCNAALIVYSLGLFAPVVNPLDLLLECASGSGPNLLLGHAAGFQRGGG